MLVRSIVATLLFAALASPAHAQDAYPNRPIRIVVGFQAGSASDVAARVVGQKLNEILQTSVIVENRPGGSSDIAAKAVAAAPPDGYTLYLCTVANAINLASKGPGATDISTALLPIAQIGEVPNILVVNPGLPAHTVGDVIRLAKKKPGTLAYASAGNGSALHMAAELFSTISGIRLLHVPYQGSAPAMADLLGGRTSLMFAPASTVLALVKAGQLRAIASATTRRLASAPDIPTAAEQGLANFESSVWTGLLAPVGLPAPIARKLEAAILQATASNDVVAQFSAQGIDVVQRDHASFAAYIKSENTKWSSVIQASSLKLN